MEWARILAYITGTVDQELLLRNEYLVAENRVLKAQLKGRLRLSDGERANLGEIGHRLGRKALGEVATVALPDTILAWYRRLVARKFDRSRAVLVGTDFFKRRPLGSRPCLSNAPGRPAARRITIRSFAFTVGSPICACWRSRRLSRFRTLRSRIRSSNG
jgi:hypothetical protein